MATEEFPGISAATRQKIGISVGLVGGGLSGMAVYSNLGDLPAGLVMTVLTGVGLYFLLPYVVPPRDEETGFLIAASEETDGFHVGAAGVAVTGGGFFFMAGLFTFDQVVPALGIACVFALVEYLVFSRVLPRGHIQNQGY